jgi:uncharacterized protein DUF2399
MEPADYRAALARGDSTPLTGHPATSPWNPALAEALAATGRAVMEERLLPALIADLATAASKVAS